MLMWVFYILDFKIGIVESSIVLTTKSPNRSVNVPLLGSLLIYFL